MADYETVELEVRDGVAHLTLNRPDAANGINLPLARDLMDAVLAVAADPAARVVLLTGAGRGSAGEATSRASRAVTTCPRTCARSSDRSTSPSPRW